MSESFSKSASGVNQALWWGGWRIKATIAVVTIAGAIAGHQLDMPYLLGFSAFLFVSPVVAFVAVRHVNKNYAELLNAFHSDCRRKAESLISLDDEDVETFMLRSGSGSKIFRRPYMEYSTVTLLVTDYSLTIHDDNLLNMVSLSIDISDNTEEIYYDQIASVNYDEYEDEDAEGGIFEVNRSDGESNSWETDREPENALDKIQQRVRDYKRQTAKQ